MFRTRLAIGFILVLLPRTRYQPPQAAGARLRSRISGDEQEGVKQAPPIRLGEIAAQAVRDQGQRGYEMDRELAGCLVTITAAALAFLVVPLSGPSRRRRPIPGTRAGTGLTAWPRVASFSLVSGLWMRWLLSRMVKLRGRSTDQIIA